MRRVREQEKKRSAPGAVTERKTEREGAKERGVGRTLLGRGGGGSFSSAGVSRPAQLHNSG